MFRFQVDLLGSCRVALVASGEEVAFKTRKTRCLLGLLLLSPGQRMNREKLASLLWDPSPEALARSSLRQALRELREVLGPDGEDLVDADAFTVGLKGAGFDLDVRRFREHVERFDALEAAGPQAAHELHLGRGGQHLRLALQPIPGADLDDVDPLHGHGA